MPARPFFLQLSGWMGSGKSTIARAVGARTGAAVIDHDTTKSAILAAGIPHPPAGAASYEVLFAVAADLVGQGLAVIIDSTSVYASVPERGLEIASAARIPYFFVNCSCPSTLAADRITARVGRPSQVVDVAAAAAVRASSERRTHRPATGAFVVDTTRPLADCVEAVLAYLDGPGAEGPSVPADDDAD